MNLENLTRKELEKLVIELEKKVNLLEKEKKKYRLIIRKQGGLINNHKFELLRTFVETIEARDPYTKGHSERVTKYAIAIGKVMGLDKHKMES